MKDKRIKILQLQSTAMFGGTELMVWNLIRHMDREQFKNEICFLYSKGPVGEYYENNGFKVTYLDFKPRRIFRVICKLFAIFKRGDYDIIHIYGLKINIIGRVLAKLLRCKNVVAGLRDKFPGDKESRFQLWIDRVTFPLVRFYISNSKSAAEFLVSKGFPNEKFKIVYNGIDVSRFQGKHNPLKVKKEFNIPIDERKIITCVANLRPKKGHRYLIEALDYLRKRGADFLCLLVGDGICRDELEELVKRLDLVQNVVFLGRQQKIPEILSISDIFILPSLWEGLPGCIMEAMASELPIVATDVSGVSELVVDGETGFLVPPRDGEALAGKIELLLRDDGMRKRMGAAGFDRIRRVFTLERMVKETEAIYLELMA